MFGTLLRVSNLNAKFEQTYFRVSQHERVHQASRRVFLAVDQLAGPIQPPPLVLRADGVGPADYYSVRRLRSAALSWLLERKAVSPARLVAVCAGNLLSAR